VIDSNVLSKRVNWEGTYLASRWIVARSGIPRSGVQSVPRLAGLVVQASCLSLNDRQDETVSKPGIQVGDYAGFVGAVREPP
jgi:hypothetical protein